MFCGKTVFPAVIFHLLKFRGMLKHKNIYIYLINYLCIAHDTHPGSGVKDLRAVFSSFILNCYSDVANV
jgi:hypothetical protein